MQLIRRVNVIVFPPHPSGAKMIGNMLQDGIDALDKFQSVLSKQRIKKPSTCVFNTFQTQMSSTNDCKL